MSSEEGSRRLTDEEFIVLVLRHQESDLSPAESRQLNEELRENPERLAEFTRIHDTSRLVHEIRTATISLQSQTQAASAPSGATADPASARPASWKRAILPIAACLVGLIGLAIWKFGSGTDGGSIAGQAVDPAATPETRDFPAVGAPSPAALSAARLAAARGALLDSRWQLVAGAGADYSVVNPKLVRLRRGELEFSSTEPADLVVETPHAVAAAAGTRFLIGHHSETANTRIQDKPNEEMKPKEMTRMLVLAGVVTMTNPSGTVKAAENETVVVAAHDAAPEKITVEANSDFAFDLYQQLAKENEGKNLFFSPYSVSGALAMTAEGARRETAAEMGKVLRFPDATKRTGDDAQRIPWETSLIHTGMSELNRKLNGADKEAAKAAEIRAKIAGLRKELEAVKANVAQLEADRKWEELGAERNKEREIVAKLNAELSKVDQYEIRVANALWGEKTYPFDPDYLKTIKKHYDTGGVFPVDFKTNFEGERLKINGWIEEQTEDRIKDPLPSGSLTTFTRLVLTNAIYFKGDWSVPFKDENTKERDFTLAGGGKLQMAMMHAPKLGVARYGAFNADGSLFDTPMRTRSGRGLKGLYPQADGFAVVELPYKGDDLSMVVIAPNDPAGLSAIENKLTPGNLSGWIGQLKKRDTKVYLPKFKMETDYKLGDAEEPGTLQKMGMIRAFIDPRDPKTGAQFQGMTTSTDPMEQLYITKVFHKAFVEVNEKGTEAAAATAVVMAVPMSAPADYPFIPEFRADRPFLFLIREKHSGVILFLGRMMNPAE